MRVLRRASVLISLVLVVAIAVGYLGRRSEVAEIRDQRLSRAAEVGALRVEAMIDLTGFAAGVPTSPEAAVAEIRETYPGVSACATSGGESMCAGERSSELKGSEPAPGDPETDVTTENDTVVIKSAGPDIGLVVSSPIEVRMGEDADDIDVFATANEPPGGVGSLRQYGGLRETSAQVLAAPGTYVVAHTDATIRLPAEEERFYLIVAGLSLVLLVLASTALIIEQRSLRERATYDGLTHLPNRSEFERRAAAVLASADRQDRPLCLLLCDLNDFKAINDTHGHHVGDELLRVIGRRLDRSVRDDDLVARWGGDEFVVVLPGIGTEEMGVRRAREIAEAIGGRTRIDGVADAIRVRVSVGVALLPDHADDLDGLLEAADEAMYRAKREHSVTAIALPRPVENALATI